MIKNIKDISLNKTHYNQIIDLYSTFNLINKDILTFENLKKIINDLPNNHYILLYCDINDNIIAGITLIIEQKLIHNGKCVGHVEDFVVIEAEQKKGIGSLLLGRVKMICEKSNCYKIILDCDYCLENYYIKKGFNKKGSYMGYYF
tara:strand:- start:59 stop:496 length:438 start_codon:yes stop_codon:yes gene_type:complete